jgi:hypothetical protein
MLPFEERTVDRASAWVFRKGVALTTCSPAWKPDLKQIRSELRPLLDMKGEPEALSRFEAVLATVSRRLRKNL